MNPIDRDLLEGGWHLDKRISIGHLVTTITVTAAICAWMFQLENRVAVAEVRVEQVERNVAASHTERAVQYAEIIRRLEHIDQKIDQKHRND